MEVLTMAEPDIQTARELATHAADIKHLQDDMDKLISDVNDIKTSLQSIQSTLSEAKGGWRMLMLIGGASGTVGAAITQFAHYVSGK
jgi:prefoldin subunit 5